VAAALLLIGALIAWTQKPLGAPVSKIKPDHY
jgi:hypothetical protein